MNIKPCGTYVLVEMEEVEQTTESGIVIATAKELQREQDGHDVGVVRAVGNLCYMGLNGVNDDASPEERASQWGVSIGDRVEFDRYSGKRLDHPGCELFRLIPDNLIMASLEG